MRVRVSLLAILLLGLTLSASGQDAEDVAWHPQDAGILRWGIDGCSAEVSSATVAAATVINERLHRDGIMVRLEEGPINVSLAEASEVRDEEGDLQSFVDGAGSNGTVDVVFVCLPPAQVARGPDRIVADEEAKTVAEVPDAWTTAAVVFLPPRGETQDAACLEPSRWGPAVYQALSMHHFLHVLGMVEHSGGVFAAEIQVEPRCGGIEAVREGHIPDDASDRLGALWPDNSSARRAVQAHDADAGRHSPVPVVWYQPATWTFDPLVLLFLLPGILGVGVVIFLLVRKFRTA